MEVSDVQSMCMVRDSMVISGPTYANAAALAADCSNVTAIIDVVLLKPDGYFTNAALSETQRDASAADTESLSRMQLPRLLPPNCEPNTEAI